LASKCKMGIEMAKMATTMKKPVEYEIVEETYCRSNGTRFKIQKILEKRSCKIIGKRKIELC